MEIEVVPLAPSMPWSRLLLVAAVMIAVVGAVIGLLIYYLRGSAALPN